MKETITPDLAKSSWQNMLQQEVKKIRPIDGSGFVFFCLGMEIPERDHTVFTLENIFFPDHSPVKISAKINNCFVAFADIFAVHNPLLWAVFGHLQVKINNCLQKLCPEDLCQGFMTEEIPGGFNLP
jgi:hypothetical protein